MIITETKLRLAIKNVILEEMYYNGEISESQYLKNLGKAAVLGTAAAATGCATGNTVNNSYQSYDMPAKSSSYSSISQSSIRLDKKDLVHLEELRKICAEVRSNMGVDPLNSQNIFGIIKHEIINYYKQAGMSRKEFVKSIKKITKHTRNNQKDKIDKTVHNATQRIFSDMIFGGLSY